MHDAVRREILAGEKDRLDMHEYSRELLIGNDQTYVFVTDK